MNHCGAIITENDVNLFLMSTYGKTGTNTDTDPLSQLGAKVFRKRKEGLQISQEELIARMNQTVYRPDVARQSHISNIENSDGDKLPSIRVLAALAVALETNCDYLLGLSDDDKPASDLEDQIVVGVPNPAERAVLQGIMDLLLVASADDRRLVADLLRRLVTRPKESAPIVTVEGATGFVDLLIQGGDAEQGEQPERHTKRQAPRR